MPVTFDRDAAVVFLVIKEANRPAYDTLPQPGLFGAAAAFAKEHHQ